MDLKLKDKAAWITGSSRGIGFACAKRLAEEGCLVGLSARNKADLESARRKLQEEFGKDRILAFEGDVSVPEAAHAMAQSIGKAWGRLDILVANAGIGKVPGASMPSDEDWEFALRQNLYSAVQAVLESM